MDTTCVRHTVLPHASRLFADFLYRFDRVASFYEHAPFENRFGAAAEAVRYPGERRAALVAELRRQNGDSQQADRLEQPDTVAVVTGQQVGLFTGPAYTMYKALTAVRLAQALSEGGVAAVPVFWLATEDHDFDEVSRSWVFDAHNRPVELRLKREDGPARPVGGVPLRDVPVAALRQVLQQFPFGEEVAAAVEAAYRPGAPMGGAFAALLRALTGRFGLLLIDPLAPAIRKLAAPLLGEAYRRSDELVDALLERNRQLEAAGYHAQVHVEKTSSLFFQLQNGRRTAIQPGVSADGSVAPESLSPNALLRPVMQDYLLPTVAYVGGPAELAYLAQSQVLYRALLGRMPVVYPRSGFTLLDARAQKLFERYRLSMEDFFHGEDSLREKIASGLMPPALRETHRQTVAAVEAGLDGLRAELGRFDATLVSALDKSRRKILYQLAKTDRKIARERMKRDARAAADASFLYNLLYPHRHLQERLYTILPFLARHGLDLLDRLYENVHLDCPDHAVLTV